MRNSYIAISIQWSIIYVVYNLAPYTVAIASASQIAHIQLAIRIWLSAHFMITYIAIY